MKPETGILLRVVGPLIEVVCVAIFLTTRGQGRHVSGIPLETVLMAGFGLGLGMVVAGLVLVKKPARKSTIPDLDLDPPRKDLHS